MRRRRDGHDTIAQKCNGSDHVGALRCTKRFTPAPMLKNGHAAYYLCSFQIWRKQFSELFSLGSQRRFIGIERELDVEVWQTSVPSGRCLLSMRSGHCAAFLGLGRWPDSLTSLCICEENAGYARNRFCRGRDHRSVASQ
jgi:hypothetical protein